VNTRVRRLASSAALALGVVGLFQWRAAAATSFSVTNSGMSAYVVNGANNPVLTLTRGQTYTFTVTALGHPFWITTARGAGDADSSAYPGVMNNGASPGTVTFTVPPTAPPTLFYQCNFHDPMGGTLSIVDPPPPVPAGGAGRSAVLAGLMLLAGAALLRRRQNARAAMRSQDQ
jgi:hypothetical protein